jgi:hypothetical protein
MSALQVLMLMVPVNVMQLKPKLEDNSTNQ